MVNKLFLYGNLNKSIVCKSSFAATKVELLQDFLSKLFEPPIELRVPRMPKIGSESFHQIHKQYMQVMEKVDKYGYLERAIKGS